MDLEIDGLKSKAQSISPLIARKNAEIDGLKTSLKTAKDKALTSQVKKKALEGQVEEQDKLVKKHQGELNSLKSNEAYKAMLSEIENAKNEKSKIEDGILALMEQIDSAEKDFKATEQTLKTQESSIRTEIQKLESEKAAIEAQAQAKKAERDVFAATITPASLTQYEGIRVRRYGVAIVPVVNKCCGGCQMSLTPNKIIEVTKAKNVIYCENCTRILYYPVIEAAPASAAAPATPASPAPSA